MKSWHREVLRIARTAHASAALDQTPGGHLRVRLTGPAGTRVVIAAATPSDHYRAQRNIKAALRRAAREVEAVLG